MSDQVPPQQPPFTNVPFSDVPNAGQPQQPGYPPQQPGYPPPQAGYPPPQQQGYPPQAGYPQAAPSTGLSENSAAAISYLTIIPAIIFLVIEPFNKMPLVRFHAIQNLLLTGAWFVVWVALTILQFALHVIPLIGFLFVFVHLAVWLGFFILWLMAIIKASKGEWYKIPVIGDQALKMARGQ